MLRVFSLMKDTESIRFQMPFRMTKQVGQRGKSADVIMSAPSGCTNSLRWATTWAVRFKTVAAVRRKAALRWSDSTSVTLSSGRSSRQAASTRPGRPAPDPKSTIWTGALGVSVNICSESSICRSRKSERVAFETRFIRLFHFRTRPS